MTGLRTMAVVTFRISSELKVRVDNLVRKTNRSSSYFYNQLVIDHINEIEDAYDCLEIMESVKKVRKRPYCLRTL